LGGEKILFAATGLGPQKKKCSSLNLQSRNYMQTRRPVRYLTLVVRTNKDAARLALEVQAAIHSLDRNTPISEVQTMEQVVSKLLESRVSI